MKFYVILHDLNWERGEALSSGHSELIGTIEADSEQQAADSLNLSYKCGGYGPDDESLPRYSHHDCPGIEIELDAPHLGKQFSNEDELVRAVKDAMKTRDEVYHIHDK